MLPTSALTGQHVDRLALEISRRLVANPPAAGQAVPFLPSHVDTLQRIRQALADGKTDAAGRMVAEFARGSAPGCGRKNTFVFYAAVARVEHRQRGE